MCTYYAYLYTYIVLYFLCEKRAKDDRRGRKDLKTIEYCLEAPPERTEEPQEHREHLSSLSYM